MMQVRSVGTALVVCGLLLSPGAGFGHGPGHQHSQDKTTHTAPAATSNMTIPNLVLHNQDGEKIHFYRDLIQGKVVAMNFIYTTCTTICPPLAATFSQLQNLLGERLGQEVHLISISVDPVTDTPARLKAWGAKFHAQPGWTLVTGSRFDIDKLLKALGVFTALIEDHAPIVLVGDEAHGMWTRTYGLTPPEQLLALLDEMRQPTAAALSAQEVQQ